MQVYLTGFNLEQNEKLRRVLNRGGATRFNDISDSVTHVIVGDIVSADLKALKSSGFRYGMVWYGISVFIF
jgi:topoisomerase (DNA) II binding protein 1